MDLDFLKDIFDGRSLTFEDFKDAVNGSENVKIANLAGGGYVSKDKYAALENSVGEYQKKINKLQKSADDAGGLKERISELSAEYETKIKNMRMDTALKMAVNSEAYDADIVIGLIDKSVLKLQDDDSVVGLDEQISNLKQSKPFLFKSGFAARSGYQPAGGGGTEAVNPWKKETFNLTEQGKILKEDPAKARAMAGAAGIKLNGGR